MIATVSHTALRRRGERSRLRGRAAGAASLALALAPRARRRRRKDHPALHPRRIAERLQPAGLQQGAERAADRSRRVHRLRQPDPPGRSCRGGRAAAAGGGGAGGRGGDRRARPPTPAERAALSARRTPARRPLQVGDQIVRPGVVHADIASAFSSLPDPAAGDRSRSCSPARWCSRAARIRRPCPRTPHQLSRAARRRRARRAAAAGAAPRTARPATRRAGGRGAQRMWWPTLLIAARLLLRSPSTPRAA